MVVFMYFIYVIFDTGQAQPIDYHRTESNKMKHTWTLAVVLEVFRILHTVHGDTIPATREDCFPIYTTPREVPVVRRLPRKKTVVWIDALHNGSGLRNSYHSVQFHKCTGMARNCVLLPHVIGEPRVECGNKTIGPVNADAVLIMGAHLSVLPIPLRRDPDQVFVFVERENWKGLNAYYTVRAPAWKCLIGEHMHYFNWTMTYRIDSDILFPYGHVIPVSQQHRAQKNYAAIYARKKYSVVWLVSHCRTPSLRSHYVHELQKYIQVHIYGDCGNYTCRDAECLRRIIREYKFVLSFENTYYPNYVTEKLFSWFERDVIQVVRGGGIDYSMYGISNDTIIDADNFPSPKDLALYMNSVGNNKTMYIDYLRSKDRYSVLPMHIVRQAAYCNLCGKLNNVNKWRKSYTNVAAWFSSKLFQKTFCPVTKN